MKISLNPMKGLDKMINKVLISVNKHLPQDGVVNIPRIMFHGRVPCWLLGKSRYWMINYRRKQMSVMKNETTVVKIVEATDSMISTQYQIHTGSKTLVNKTNKELKEVK